MRKNRKKLSKLSITAIVLGVIMIIGLVYKFFKNKKTKPTDTGEQATSIMQDMGVSATDMTILNNKALGLAEGLGTMYSWWNIKAWYERDENVFNLLKNITQTEFDILSKLYFEVYAKGNNLSQDLASKLDSKYYELLLIK